MRTILPALLLALAPSAAPGVEAKVDAALDRTSATLGDRVVATYTLRAPKGARLTVDTLFTPKPAEDAPAGSGAVLEYEKVPPAETAKSAGGSAAEIVLVQRVPFAPFAAGTLSVPGPMLTLLLPDGSRTGLRAPALALTVASRLPDAKKKEELAPRPERDIRIPAISPWWFVTAGLLLLAVAGGVALWLRRRARRGFEGRAAEPEALPAGAELLAALERLAGAADRLGADPRGFYSELTHVVKRYLERRLDLPVLEWTTFETVRRLREAGLEPPREAGLPELLSAADFVKFGKGSSTREGAKEHLTRARLLHDGLEAELARRAEAERAARAAQAAKAAKSAGAARS